MWIVGSQIALRQTHIWPEHEIMFKAKKWGLFHTVMWKVSTGLQAVMWKKSSTSYDSIACRTDLGYVNLNFITLTLLWRNFGPLLFTMLGCCFSSWRFAGIHTSRKSHHSIWMRLRCGLWLSHCNTSIPLFFNPSIVDFLLCLRLQQDSDCSFGQALVIRQIILVYRGVHSWMSECNVPILWPLHCHA